MIHPYAYYLGRAARGYPERIAVIEGDRRLTYRELDRRVTALARALGRLGVRPGDRIAVLQANNHEFMEGVARPRAAPAHMVAACGARVLIAPAQPLAARARALRERVPGVSLVIAVGGGAGALDYEELLSAAAGGARGARGARGRRAP